MESVLNKLNESEALYSSEEEFSDDDRPPLFQGKLCKWTNMLHGWQERFFVLKDGMLSYYKSRDDINFGCRGSIRLQNSIVRPHEADDCRFELRVGDSIWYLRGANLQERKQWIQSMEHHRISESGYGSSEQNLRRQNSWHSLNSAASLSIASASSFKRSHGLKEKLAEMETFKEILCRQVESLQNYFDTCSAIVRDSAHDHLERYLEEEHDSTNDDHSLSNESRNRLQQSTQLQQLNQQHPNNTQNQLNNNKSSTLYHHNNDTSSDCSNITGASGVSSNNSSYFNNCTNTTPISNLPSAVINNGQIETANNGTIFEDDREQIIGEQPRLKEVSKSSDNLLITDELIDDEEEELPDINESTTGEEDDEVEYENDKEDNTPNLQQQPIQQQPQPTRSFLSKFFPFRSSSSNTVPTPVVTTTPTIATTSAQQRNSLDSNSTPLPCYPDQYEPSLRFEDLKKIIKQHGGHALDFKGESYTFKATTTGILTNLAYCVEIMQHREETWRRRVDRESDRRKRIEDTNRHLQQEIIALHAKLCEVQSKLDYSNNNGNYNQKSTEIDTNNNCKVSNSTNKLSSRAQTTSTSSTMLIVGSPDLEEGPNCTIGEEEFFDAVDAQLDQMELADDRIAAFKSLEAEKMQLVAGNQLSCELSSNHGLYCEVKQAVERHFVYCDQSASELLVAVDGWELMAEENDMKIYKKEVERDGTILEPLQIIFEVRGVTAREICKYFWDVKYRMDWEISIDQPPTILEWCSEDTVVLHQVYKRVWPTTQRDSVFWSHIRQMNPPNQPLSKSNMWMVVNYSTNYRSNEVDESSNQMIRLSLDVVLICQTVIDDDIDVGVHDKISRDKIRCRILYASCINPGGWAPASVLKTVARREYPRFIKRFSQYVIDKTVDLPIEL